MCNLALAYMLSGQDEAAVQCATRAVEADPQDQVSANVLQFVREVPVTNLAGTDDNVIDLQQAALTVYADMQTLVVDTFVADISEHMYAAPLEA